MVRQGVGGLWEMLRTNNQSGKMARLVKLGKKKSPVFSRYDSSPHKKAYFPTCIEADSGLPFVGIGGRTSLTECGESFKTIDRRHHVGV